MTNEIVPKTETPLAKPLAIGDVPEMQPVEEGDTLRIPRLILVQEKHKGIAEGWAKAGELMNSLTKESYGKSLEIVPIYQRPMTRVKWAPRMMGGGIQCINRNKTSPNGSPTGDPKDAVGSCEE